MTPSPKKLAPKVNAAAKPIVKNANISTLSPAKKSVVFTPPNWMELDSYKHFWTASLQAIAWEFLRRNPDYQRAWIEYASRVRKMAESDAELLRYVEVILSSDATTEDWEELGDSVKINALSNRLYALEHWWKSSGNPASFIALDAHYGSTWGLDRMVNPGVSYGDFRIRFSESATKIPVVIQNIMRACDKVPGDVYGLRDTKWLALVVDLSLPLKVIDSQVKIMIRSQREIKAKAGFLTPVNNREVSPKKYVEYLRILDADAAGIKPPEIGKTIDPNRTNHAEARQRDKQFAAALAEAKRLRNEGYRVLTLLSDTSKSTAKNKPHGQF